jgi:hypothetical protein
MSLIQRIQDILLRPRQTWPVIAAEPADTASLYSGYVVVLAAVPALATFIGLTLSGLPVMVGLLQLVIGYVLSLVMVYVLALIVDALAPTFGGAKSPIDALKLVAYGSTAGFLGGVFNLIPFLAVLGLLAALYSIYLIYTGLPVLMKCPPEKAVAYTAVVVVCGIVAMVILGAITSLVLPAGPLRMGGTADSAEPGFHRQRSIAADSGDAAAIAVTGGRARVTAAVLTSAGPDPARIEATERAIRR